MIRTVHLTTEIPASREIHITLPADIPLGPAEIVVVVSSSAPVLPSTLGNLLNSELLGMWRDRTDIADSLKFAEELRSQGWKRSA